MDFTFALQCVI